MDWPFQTQRTTADKDWSGPEVVEAANDIDYSLPIENGPTARGFDSYFGVDVPNFPPYCFIEGNRTIGLPDRPKPESMFGTPGPMVDGWDLEEILPELTRRAVATIDERAQAGEPFFLYFPLTAPHTPIAPTPQFRGKSRAGAYGDFVMQVDDTVGQVAAALKRNGLDKNTLLIVASDNGSPGRNGSLEAPGTVIETFGHNPSWILRGMKADTWDGGHRIPLIARWPEQMPAGSTCDEMVCLMDLMATCAELIEEPLPDGAAEDSISILPYLMGEEVEEPLRNQLVHHGVDGLYGVREGPWKLIMGTGSGGFSPDPEVGTYDPPQQLYHMQNDIRERHNRYFEEPDIVRTPDRSFRCAQANTGCRASNDFDRRKSIMDYANLHLGMLSSVVADTFRTAYLGAYGNEWIRTPNLDRFALEGVRFTNAHPECLPTIPTRRTLHSGRRAFPFNDYRPVPWDNVYLPGWQPMSPDEPAIAEALVQHGYHTGFFADVPHYFVPGMNFTRGFNQWQYIRGHAEDRYNAIATPIQRSFRPLLGATRTGSRPPGQRAAGAGLRKPGRPRVPSVPAMQFLEQNQRNKPFYLYVDSFSPHETWEAPLHYYDLYGSREDREPICLTVPYGPIPARRSTRNAWPASAPTMPGLVTMVDAWFGKLIDTIDRLGLRENTLVIFLSDHGTNFADNPERHHRQAGVRLYPGTMDIPLIARHPAGQGRGYGERRIRLHIGRAGHRTRCRPALRLWARSKARAFAADRRA